MQMISISETKLERRAGLRLLFSAVLCAGVLLSAPGCGDETDGEHDHDAHVQADAGGDGNANACDSSSFAAGLMAHGKDMLMVTLVSFDHDPPQVQQNDWVVKVTTHDGTPVEDVELKVRAFLF